MSRPLYRWAAIIQIGLVLFTGCHPTQPFFVARDESLANYVAQSMEIEYADVVVDSLPEATQAHVPLGPDELPSNFVDLSLEDCISMALQNAKILTVVNGSNLQSGSVAAPLLSAAPGQMPSIYDPALVATTANTQPLTIDSQGNRIAPRGFTRANQVGGVEDALSEFDAQWSALFGYNTTDRPRNVGPGNDFNPQFFQAVDANAQTALSKRLATGTIATARLTNVYSRNNIRPNNVGRSVPSDYTTAIELNVTQPLLRGRGTLVNRIPIVLARINEDIELHQFEANVRNLVKSVEDAYWDLYCGYRAFDSSKVAQASSLNLWRVADARTRIGDTPPEAEAQARASYAQFQGQVHIALYGTRVPGNDLLGLYGREQVLREKIGWAATDGQLIRPSDEPSFARVEFDWSNIQAEALTRSTELRLQKWAIKQRELELIKAKNEILPQLDTTLFYRFLGVGDTLAKSERTGLNFPAAGSNALEELTGGDYQELGARLEFTPHALGKRRPLTNIKNSQIALVKFKEELRQKEFLLIHEISRAWREMKSAFVSMADYQAQWQASEDEIEIYYDKIATDVGELSQLLDILLRAEERRARSRLLYDQAVCEYNKSMVNIHYLKGSLLDLNSISLEEGPWVDKAYWDADERASERASGIYFDYGYTRPGVISNGPVESGGATEGNIAIPGFTYGQQAIGGESSDTSPLEEIDPPSTLDGEVDGEPEGDDPELAPLPEREGPTASMPDRLRMTDSVTRASAQSSQTESIWGEMGLGSDSADQPAPIVQGREAQRLNTSPSRAISNDRAVRIISSGNQSDRQQSLQDSSPNSDVWRSR